MTATLPQPPSPPEAAQPAGSALPSPASATSAASSPASATSHKAAKDNRGWLPNVPPALVERLRPNPARTTAQWTISWVLVAISLMLAWFVVFCVGISALQYGHRQAVLYSKLREELAAETAPLGGAITPGAPIAVMTFSRAKLHNVVIVEGTASGDLASGPGHRRDSPLPGQAGTSFVYGRASLFGAPFGDVARAHRGDTISVTTAEGQARFVVDDVRHAGDPEPTPVPAGGARLTLVTADSSGWRTGWAPASALYVDATLQGAPFITPAGRPAAVPKAELAMRGDPSALYSLVLWLPLLLIGVLSAVWAHVAWGRWHAWVVGVPVVLAGLWGVSETAGQLLPNLM